jgi:hypothetical protein
MWPTVVFNIVFFPSCWNSCKPNLMDIFTLLRF